MRILLVEDDPVVLSYLESALTGLGHSVHPAEDGELAWSEFNSGTYEAIISDWNLPGLSGTGLCERIRKRKAREYAYFILITSGAGQLRVAEAIDAGVDDFLTKPVDVDALSIRIRVAERILSFQREVGRLKAMVPLCMYCKRVRNDQQFWENVETYLQVETGADITHSLCPDCHSTVVKPQLEALRRETDGRAAGS